MKRKVPFIPYNIVYALFTVCVFNASFLSQLWGNVSWVAFGGVFVLLVILYTALQLLIFGNRTIKFFSLLFLCANAVAAYFISTYHIALNKMMLSNVLDTNFFEATEWLGKSFWLYILFLCIVPAFLVIKFQIKVPGFKTRFKFFLSAILLGGILSTPFMVYKKDVSIFLKENFNLKYQLVPSSYIYSLVSLVKNHLEEVRFIDSTKGLVQKKYWKGDKKNLLVFVLGESLREANFSLSNYERDTAEPLRKYEQDLVVFKKTMSCGVSTRVSLPCMFTAYSQNNYDERGISYTSNALDILQKSGLDVLWLDNELGCNKVCRNIPTEFTCDSRECVDSELNNVFKEKLPDLKEDAVVVLHQRGSHGPRYDLREPEEFRKWTPYCQDADYQNCSYQEIVNAYDNSIYYTSFLLADLIETLSEAKDRYNPILIFISDHGESLGEDGFWGHGGKVEEAPRYQREVPFFIWIPQSSRIALGMDKKCLDEKTKNTQSHDAIFHSLLGLFGVKTDVYMPQLDIFSACHP